jgi:hypothetical protein
MFRLRIRYRYRKELGELGAISRAIDRVIKRRKILKRIRLVLLFAPDFVSAFAPAFEP